MRLLLSGRSVTRWEIRGREFGVAELNHAARREYEPAAARADLFVCEHRIYADGANVHTPKHDVGASIRRRLQEFVGITVLAEERPEVVRILGRSAELWRRIVDRQADGAQAIAA